jgi:hypothetical protein
MLIITPGIQTRDNSANRLEFARCVADDNFVGDRAALIQGYL